MMFRFPFPVGLENSNLVMEDIEGSVLTGAALLYFLNELLIGIPIMTHYL